MEDLQKPKHLLDDVDISTFESKNYVVITLSDDAVPLVDSVFDLGIEFFRLSKSEKQQNTVPDLEEGWSDCGFEYNTETGRPDLSEGFWMVPKYTKTVLKRYDDTAVNLHSAMLDFVGMIGDVNKFMIRKLATSYGHTITTADQFNCEEDSECEVLYYQPSRHNRDLLNDPHDDGLFITYLKANQPGLEVRIEGEYQPIETKSNQIVAISGEILTLMSGGRIEPAYHRVRRYPNQKERLTLAYFTIPNIGGDKRIDPWVYSEINERVNILEKTRENNEQYVSN